MSKASKAKKLVSVLATSALMTSTSKKTQVTQTTHKMIVDQVFCIHYLIQFWKDKKKTIWALIDSSSKVNAMILVYAKKLGL